MIGRLEARLRLEAMTKIINVFLNPKTSLYIGCSWPVSAEKPDWLPNIINVQCRPRANSLE